MKLIKIPTGIEKGWHPGQPEIDRRQRFFSIVTGIIENSKMTPAEIVDLAGWYHTAIANVQDDYSVIVIKLKDHQYDKFKTFFEKFDGYQGLGSADTLLAIFNAEYVDETKI